MGREIRRVPLDFNWPLKKVWSGFLMPESLREKPCPSCKSGYSPQAQYLHDLWYGYVPFDPAALEPSENWPELYQDWDEMAAAQQWNPGDFADHLPDACVAATPTRPTEEQP